MRGVAVKIIKLNHHYRKIKHKIEFFLVVVCSVTNEKRHTRAFV